MAVAASAARTAKAKGGWGTGVTTAPHHQGLAAAAAVVLVAHGADIDTFLVLYANMVPANPGIYFASVESDLHEFAHLKDFLYCEF